MNKILGIFILCLLTGCKVGPNYHVPKTMMQELFVEDVAERTKEVSDEDLVHWWRAFNDPFLDGLLEQTLAGNFDFKIAFERVFQARSEYWIQFTQILPELDGTATASRYRISRSFASETGGAIAPNNPTNGAALATGTTLSPIQNFYQVGLDAIWEIDLWGKFRRAADAAYDLWEASVDDLNAVKIVIISEVANTYASICALQKNVSTAMDIVRLDQDLLLFTRVRFEAGLSSELEMDTAIAALNADQSQLVLLEADLKQSIYSLAVLIGRLPEEIIQDFQVQRMIPRSDEKIPVSLPSELLRRRPDVRSAERQLAAATEQIGVAIADLFPSLSLTGSSSSFASNPLQGANVGYSSDTLNKLFRPASLLWGIGGFVQMPIWDFGKRQAAVQEQIALRNQAYFNYQKTVLQAIQETEQALAVYFSQEKSTKNLRRQVLANKRSLDLTADLFQAGLVNYTEVLQARDIWLISVNLETSSEQALMTDLIAVYKALGGNW